MTIESGQRHLDLGGITPDITKSVFFDLAMSDPQGQYCVVDFRAGDVDLSKKPRNLEIVTPGVSEVSYKIPYPDDYFNDVRMDMVLDYLQDQLMFLLLFSEINRVMVKGGSLHIVDLEDNLFMIKDFINVLGFDQVLIQGPEELMNSGYKMSYHEKFKKWGNRFFHCQAIK